MEFKGMALYGVEEIGSALEEYRTSVNEVKAIIREKVAQAELDWKPTWWQKLWGVKTLEQYWKSNTMWQGYWGFLDSEGFVTFNEDEVSKLTYVDGRDFNMVFYYWSSEYNQIKNLYNGGKECYLNPNQAAFVNKFKGGKQ
jgi:hypothetical protein